MDISLVVPVWNDRAGLRNLLEQVQALGLFSEVIIVDDCSDDDHSPIGLELDISQRSPRFEYIRLPEQRGAGHARNVGLEKVTGSHVLFFDSDDLLGDQIELIVSALKEQEVADLESGIQSFDFCIFRHHDSRVSAFGRRGTFEIEENYWRQAGAVPVPRLLSSSEAATLCRIAAYPWNKIYSMAFLRAHGLRCTELLVHNDVELHWSSFIEAKRILCTSWIGAEHFVEESGSRLTNRKDAERLMVFEAFTNVLRRMRHVSDIRSMLEPFTAFVDRLLTWIEGNMNDEFREELRRRASRFFLQEYSRQQMVVLAYQNPSLALRINTIIMEGAK